MSRSCHSGTFSKPTTAAARTRDPLQLGIEARVGADRARELPDPAFVEPARQARPRAVELERPARELPAERRRLGVNAVRAPDADRAPVLVRAAHDDGE